MAIQQIINVWEHELPHNEQAVALAYADHANEDGTGMWPSTERIAWKTGYTRRTVQRIRAKMVERGLLVKVRDATNNRPNEYEFDWSAVPKKEPFDAAAPKGSPEEGRKNDAPKTEGEGRKNDAPSEGGGATRMTPQGRHALRPRGDTHDAPGATPVSPEPSYNRQTTPSQPSAPASASEQPTSESDSFNRPEGWGEERNDLFERLTSIGVKPSTAANLIEETDRLFTILGLIRKYELERQQRDVGPGLLVHWIREGEDPGPTYRRNTSVPEYDSEPADEVPDWRAIMQEGEKRKAERKAGQQTDEANATKASADAGGGEGR